MSNAAQHVRMNECVEALGDVDDDEEMRTRKRKKKKTVIVDPCCGGGTILYAAWSRGKRGGPVRLTHETYV